MRIEELTGAVYEDLCGRVNLVRCVDDCMQFSSNATIGEI